MKNMMKKIAVVLTLSLIVGVSVPTFQSDAQVDCSTYQNTGNLTGYIIATNLPEDGQNIYVNSLTDPWEPDHGYSVSYVTTENGGGYFTGRGWNETLGWIDFDYGTDDEADALSPDGNFAWGGYTGTIEGLQTVVYSTNTGSFSAGEAKDTEYVSGQSQGDVQVGMGLLDFSNVSRANTPSDADGPCAETIDVLVNGRSSANIGACGQTATVSWNSKNVSNCQTAGNAPWNSPGSRGTSSSGENSGLITSGNSGSFFRIQCEGDNTNDIIVGSAQVRCGVDDTCPGPNCPDNADVNNFQFIES